MPRPPELQPQVIGTVLTYDGQDGLLNVKTKRGSRLFLLTGATSVLLNDHPASENDILVGDDVTVTYDNTNSDALVVALTREARREGQVTAINGTSLGFKTKQGTTFTLQMDAKSSIVVGGIPVDNLQILVGQPATLLYEPVTFLVLGLSVNTSTVAGALTAVDTKAQTIMVARNQVRTYTIDPNATIHRNGKTATLADLVVGDRINVACTSPGRRSNRALAIDARSVTPVPTN